MKRPLSEFGKVILKGCIDSGISLKDMAHALDVGPSFISAIIRGNKRIPRALIPRIESYFCCLGVENLNLNRFAKCPTCDRVWPDYC